MGSVCPADPASTKDCFDLPRLRAIGGITAGQVRRTDGQSAQPEKSSPHPGPRLDGQDGHQQHAERRHDESGNGSKLGERGQLADGSHSRVRITAL